ncbi:MAG: hypothetical protein QM677_11355 [Microbacterium sp.]
MHSDKDQTTPDSGAFEPAPEAVETPAASPLPGEEVSGLSAPADAAPPLVPAPPPLPQAPAQPVLAAPELPAAGTAVDGAGASTVAARPTWLDPRTVGLAAVAGAIGVGAALAAAVLVVLLTLLFAFAGGGFSALDGIDLGDVDLSQAPVVSVVIWIATLGLFGQLTGGTSLSIFGVEATATVLVSFVPVLVLLAAAGAAAWWSYRQERARRTASRVGVWALGVAAGLGAALLTLLLSPLSRHDISADATMLGSVEITIWTMTAASFFGPLATVTLAAVTGRWLARGIPARHFGAALWQAPSRFRWGTRDLYDYLVVLTVVFTLASLVSMFVIGEGAAGAWPLTVAVAAVLAASIGHLGGYSLTAEVTGVDGFSQVLWLFSPDANGFVWVLPLLAVISALAASVLIARRRAIVPVPLGRAWLLPVLMLAASLSVGLLLGDVASHGEASAVGANMSYRAGLAPVWWTYPLAFVWGAIVEALTRFVAPVLLATWPVLGRVKLSGEPAAAAAPATPAFAAPPAPDAPADGSGSAPAQPSVSATASDGAASAAAPLSPAAKRRLLIGGIAVGALAVVGIAGAVVVTVLQGSVFSPKVAVQTYLDDIAAGRFASAFELSGGSATGDVALVESDDVELASAIEDVTLSDPQGSGETRTVEVSYTVGGERQTSTVVVRSAGKQFLFFDSWEIDQGIETDAYVGGYGLEELVIGGVSVPLVDESASLIAYPGVYDVAAPESTWLTLETDSLTVTSIGGSVTASVVATDALQEEVQSQVDAIIDECAATAEAAPDGCPFSLYSWGDTRNVVWTVAEYPVVELSGVDYFSTEEYGEVSVTYEYSWYDDEWNAGDDEVSIAVYGEIEISGDTVTVTLE